MIQSEKNRSKQIIQFDETKLDKIHLPLLQPKIEHIFHKFRDKTNRQSLPGIHGLCDTVRYSSENLGPLT